MSRFVTLRLFHIFGPLKDAPRGRRFAADELKHSVREELRRFGEEFYATEVRPLTEKWKKCAGNEEVFVEK
jgi:hypothetical protein